MKTKQAAEGRILRRPIFIAGISLVLVLVLGMFVYKQNMGIQHVTHTYVSVPSVHYSPYTRCPDGSSPDPDAKYNEKACSKPVVIYKYWPFPAITRPDNNVIVNCCNQP